MRQLSIDHIDHGAVHIIDHIRPLDHHFMEDGKINKSHQIWFWWLILIIDNYCGTLISSSICSFILSISVKKRLISRFLSNIFSIRMVLQKPNFSILLLTTFWYLSTIELNGINYNIFLSFVVKYVGLFLPRSWLVIRFSSSTTSKNSSFIWYKYPVLSFTSSFPCIYSITKLKRKLYSFE